MVQMDRESVIPKQLEGLVVVAIHVAHQEVKYGQVHHIKQPGRKVRNTISSRPIEDYLLPLL